MSYNDPTGHKLSYILGTDNVVGASPVQAPQPPTYGNMKFIAATDYVVGAGTLATEPPPSTTQSSTPSSNAPQTTTQSQNQFQEIHQSHNLVNSKNYVPIYYTPPTSSTTTSQSTQTYGGARTFVTTQQSTIYQPTGTGTPTVGFATNTCGVDIVTTSGGAIGLVGAIAAGPPTLGGSVVVFLIISAVMIGIGGAYTGSACSGG